MVTDILIFMYQMKAWKYCKPNFVSVTQTHVIPSSRGKEGVILAERQRDNTGPSTEACPGNGGCLTPATAFNGCLQTSALPSFPAFKIKGLGGHLDLQAPTSSVVLSAVPKLMANELPGGLKQFRR